MMNAEATAESRPACRWGQHMWTYAAGRTHEYESDIQVLIALLHKFQLRLCSAVGVDMGHKGVIVEDRGLTLRRWCQVWDLPLVGNITEAHRCMSKRVVVGGSRGGGERRGDTGWTDEYVIFGHEAAPDKVSPRRRPGG